MLEIYLTENEKVHTKLLSLLEKKVGGNMKIERSASGKPFIAGNPLYFSLSHSGRFAAIALSDKEIGIDLETYEKSARAEKFKRVLNSFSDREKKDICDFSDFLLNWVCKEAFVKMTSGSIFGELKRLEYFSSRLYFDGKEASTQPYAEKGENFALAICADGYSPKLISRTKFEKI